MSDRELLDAAARKTGEDSHEIRPSCFRLQRAKSTLSGLIQVDAIRTPAGAWPRFGGCIGAATREGC